ncbi:hypothetical protein [Niallia circulans]|uniref:hypothetical protein n=1 Tax=Niallia circulans TaxID=1397 RepID=UPI0026F0015A|nr:hypothetical protein [Niallia circulans]
MNKKQAAKLYALIFPITRNKKTATKIVMEMLQVDDNLGEKELARKAVNRAIEMVKK